MTLFQFIVQCSIAPRVCSIGVKQWRDDIPKAKTRRERLEKQPYREMVDARLALNEAAYQTLKEATTTLELAVWKAAINQSATATPEERESCTKKRKGNVDAMRKLCHINCGADIIIRNAVPCLLRLAEF